MRHVLVAIEDWDARSLCREILASAGLSVSTSSTVGGVRYLLASPLRPDLILVFEGEPLANAVGVAVQGTAVRVTALAVSMKQITSDDGRTLIQQVEQALGDG